MGKLAVYKYVSAMFLVAQLVITIFTIVGLFGGNVNPAGNTARAMLVYALPLLILANAVLIFYWLLRKHWFLVFIPILTIACCIPYIGTLYQFGSPDKGVDGKAGLKIASYNVALFGRETSGFMAQDILAEMRRQKVDVLCMQEYNEVSGDRKNSTSYKEYFPYMQEGRDDMVIYSRYPVKESGVINFGETNNSAMWADIDVKGKSVRIFNVHMETTGFNRMLHKAAKAESHGSTVETNRLLRAIYQNYTGGMMIRAGQARLVAEEVSKAKGPVVLCGDFNDVPYSYVYNTLLGDLVDGFKECGKGFMYTFTGNKPVRIDYIFHDESLQGVTYYKLDHTYSDHYPVLMKLAL